MNAASSSSTRGCKLMNNQLSVRILLPNHDKWVFKSFNYILTYTCPQRMPHSLVKLESKIEYLHHCSELVCDSPNHALSHAHRVQCSQIILRDRCSSQRQSGPHVIFYSTFRMRVAGVCAHSHIVCVEYLRKIRTDIRLNKSNLIRNEFIPLQKWCLLSDAYIANLLQWLWLRNPRIA